MLFAERTLGNEAPILFMNSIKYLNFTTMPLCFVLLWHLKAWILTRCVGMDDVSCPTFAHHPNLNLLFFFFYSFLQNRKVRQPKCLPNCKVLRVVLNIKCAEVFSAKMSFAVLVSILDHAGPRKCCFLFLAFWNHLRERETETTERRLHWMELIRLSVFIDCATRVSGMNQSVVLHLLGG